MIIYIPYTHSRCVVHNSPEIGIEEDNTNINLYVKRKDGINND